MGVDEHILKRLKGGNAPALGDDVLAPLPFGRPDFSASRASEKPRISAETSLNFRELRSEIRRLTSTINDLLQVFSKAHEDIKAEPAGQLAQKMDKLVEQNEEIGRALLLLLELHREHLPQISRHTRISSEMHLRRPPAARLFSERLARK